MRQNLDLNKDDPVIAKPAVRIGATVPPQVKEALEALAEARGVSIAWVMKRMFERSLALEALIEQDVQIIARDKQGNEYLLFEKGSYKDKVFEILEKIEQSK